MLAVCRALVLNQRLLLLYHGNVVQVSDAQTLRDNPELLDSLLGVPRKLYLDERGETCSLKTPGMWPAP